MRLTDRVAVITGGSSGIGLATARAFAAEGARVAIFGRDPDRLARAARELGQNALAVQGDAARVADLDRLYREVESHLGAVDGIVACAGLVRQKPFETVSEAEFDEISAANFKGVFFTVQKALPYLRDGASVILVSSALAHVGVPTSSIYSATKAAVISLGKTMAASLAPRGIRVNIISPGPVKTGVWDRLTPQARDAQRANIQNVIPMKRMARPEEIARACVFLASADSSYMTGSELVVDGGRLLV